MPRSACCLLFTRLVFGSVGICWNADAMPGNDGSCVNEDVPESKWSHLGGFQARMMAEYLRRLQSENGCRNKSIIRINCQRDNSCLAET